MSKTSKVKLPGVSLQVTSSPRGLNRVERMLGSVKSIWNLGEDAYNRICAAVSEAVKSAIQRNKGDETKILTVGMRCAGDQCEFTVQSDDRSGGKDNCIRLTFDTRNTASS